MAGRACANVTIFGSFLNAAEVKKFDISGPMMEQIGIMCIDCDFIGHLSLSWYQKVRQLCD